MSSDEDQEVVQVEDLPQNRVRFTDMTHDQVDKAIRRKFGTRRPSSHNLSVSHKHPNPVFIFNSLRGSNRKVQVG